MPQSIVAIIPARSGSKSIKNKNIKNLAGRPLIEWSIISCKKCNYIDRIIFSTDSIKYANTAKKLGVDEIIIRPKNISGDRSTDYQMIKHVIKNTRDLNFDLIAHIRPTTPIRKIDDLNLAIKKFRSSSYDSLRSVHEMPETAYKSFEMTNNKALKPLKNLKFSIDKLNNPRQKFPKTYVANGVIDIYRKNYILRKKKLFGKKVLAYKTKEAFEIDTIEQFEYINYLLIKNDKNKK